MSENLYRFYLLEKKTPGYTCIGHEEVLGSATDSVKVTARTAISQRLDLLSTTNIKLDVYQPPEPFEDRGMGILELRKKLQEIFDDKYQNTCLQFSANDRLGAIKLKEHLIVVFTFEFQFFLFDHPTNTYFGKGEVTAGADQTVGVIEGAARKYIVERTQPNVDIRIVRVVEPRESLLEQYKQRPFQLEEYDCRINADRKRVTRHVTSAPLQEINAKDSLIIEFELQYQHVLFEKTGSSYTCLGSQTISVSSNIDETVEAIIKQARASIPRLRQRELSGVYELLGNHEDLGDKTPKAVQSEVPLDDDYLFENAVACSPQTSLQTLESNILIIVFDDQDYENPKWLLEATEEEPGIEREKIAEAARKRRSPSDDAKPEELYHTQDLTRADAVRNERPMHLSGPPIQIYHPVFAKFLSRAFLPFGGDEETLRRTSEFIKASRQCYKDGVARMQALRSHLSDLVHQDIFTEATITLDDNEWMEPGATIYTGCHWGSAWPVCAFVEVKNEVGTGGCDPALQCQSDFVRLCSASTPIIDASCCPVFLLAIAGPRLLVAGAVFANNFIAQELTDYLTLGSHPTDCDRGLRRVAQVLVTLRECIQDLASFYSNLKFKLSKIPISIRKSGSRSTGFATQYVPESPLGRWVFPHYTEFKVHDDPFSLTYKGPLEGGVKTTRALFTASMKSPEAGKLAVVKFTRRYCPEAHRLLAGMLLAPQLLHHEHIAGIHFVVMEHLEATEVTGDILKGANGAKHVESLRKAVRALHNEGLVFGDLREPNILIAKDGIKLVDFDWSGKEGMVRYPADISEEILWPEGVGGEGQIKFEHDKEWFRRLTGTEL
ncbi:hypothetical protein BDM02DRAFT_3272735 [Thelephora ganbajun]|uniref:Uncharacterized protein n=1 Tax=Thelephora ganbajun TaxID=370292 RepID=A0ACB6Z2Z3_THEGA|nr:hypothetical protein BDM02DRAFT_3272735 [Thelephora ganbajun]